MTVAKEPVDSGLGQVRMSGGNRDRDPQRTARRVVTGPERRRFPVQEWRSLPGQERRGLHRHLALLVRANDEEPRAGFMARVPGRGAR